MSTSNSGSLAPAITRTLVPIIFGPVVARAIPSIDPNSPDVLLLISATLSGAYYVIVRLVEEKFPKFGWLLGIAKRPAYSPRGPVSPDDGEVLVTDVVAEHDAEVVDLEEEDLLAEEGEVDPTAVDLDVPEVHEDEQLHRALLSP